MDGGSSYFLAQGQPAIVCSLVRVPGSMARGKGSGIDGAAFGRFGGYVEDVWPAEPRAVASQVVKRVELGFG